MSVEALIKFEELVRTHPEVKVCLISILLAIAMTSVWAVFHEMGHKAEIKKHKKNEKAQDLLNEYVYYRKSENFCIYGEVVRVVYKSDEQVLLCIDCPDLKGLLEVDFNEYGKNLILSEDIKEEQT